MPPMVCFGWSGTDGLVKSKHIEHYRKRAQGGAGLIISEALCVSAGGRLADTQLGLWSDEHIKGLSEIVEACHRYGAVVLSQIHHAGIKTTKKTSDRIIGPSGYIDKTRKAEGASLQDIEIITEDFLKAAIRAFKAGFNGVELHGAHGYLLSQFASPATNTREDKYGGTIENRMRLAVELISVIRKELGSDFIIGYRMGGNEPDLAAGIRISRILENAGVDLLHVSNGWASAEDDQMPAGFMYSPTVYNGASIKKEVSLPVIVVNGIRTGEQAAHLVESGMCDFVAVGRGMLADPEWANKVLTGVPVIPCRECSRCKWFHNGKNCPASIN